MFELEIVEGGVNTLYTNCLFEFPKTRSSLPSFPIIGGGGQMTATVRPSGDHEGIHDHSADGTMGSLARDSAIERYNTPAKTDARTIKLIVPPRLLAHAALKMETPPKDKSGTLKRNSQFLGVACDKSQFSVPRLG
jgi:hypothetical protein